MLEQYSSKLLKDAVEAFHSLPGVGSRSALRLALHLIKQPAEHIHRFAAALDKLAEDLHYCKECMMICDDEICPICSDGKRDHRTICIVENVRDVMTIEESGQFKGVYHVLGGIISPINGIGPSDLKLTELVERLKRLTGANPGPDHDCNDTSSATASGPHAEKDSGVEVILALSGDVEGETTSFYIYRQIAPLGVKISTLARGIGFGDNLEYADAMTLGRSILNRQIFKP